MSEIEKAARPNTLPTFSGSHRSWDEHVNEWRTMAESLEDHLWYLGSIAASITTKYGDRAIPEFAQAVNYSPRRIYEMAATYRAWECRDRAHDLSFKHHTIAARSEDPERVIEAALSSPKPMSTRELERVVKAEDEPESVEKVKTRICEACGSEVPVE